MRIDIIILFKQPWITMSYGNMTTVFAVLSQISEVISILGFQLFCHKTAAKAGLQKSVDLPNPRKPYLYPS